MPIYRNCPHCPFLVRIGNDLIGRTVRCSRCRNTFQAEREPDGAANDVERLAQAEKHLKRQNAVLAQRLRDVQEQLEAVLAFDGNWTNPTPSAAPEFRPVGERRAPIVAVANLKGGVGKTTITANLGAVLWTMHPKQHVLLLDLDYQANLTQNCLDPKAIARLRQQDRLVQSLFAATAPEPRLVVQGTEPILDDRLRSTDGSIFAGDELLGVAEVHALTRWLVAPERDDVRFRVRSVLHAEAVQRNYDFILLDCPPRLTTTCINALAAADFVLIPVVLDEKSTEGAPRLLRWLRERRATLFPGLAGVGIVANKTRGKVRAKLVNREQLEWTALISDCHDAWQGDVCGFDTVVPFFTERAMARKFPACYNELAPTFAAFAGELRTALSRSPAEVPS